MNESLKILILFDKARKFEHEIQDAINACGSIYATYELSWSRAHLESDFSRFFEKKITLKDIEQQYGTGSLLVFLLETKEEKTLRHSIDECKTRIGIQHALYFACDRWQVNRDLTLLLGKNTEDVKADWVTSKMDRIKLNEDLVGEKPFKDLPYLFYVLNNTIHYVVLRNYEILPDNFDPSIHGDIDLLVENLLKVVSITNAYMVFPNNPSSVAHWVELEGGRMWFDFRYVGDNYLDKQWEIEVVRSARLHTPPCSSHPICVMSPVNQYFTLLYHAYIQKPYLAKDYPSKLEGFALPIGATYKNEIPFSMMQLEEFLLEHHYVVTIPSELEGFLNWRNLKLTGFYRSVRMRYLLTRQMEIYYRKAIRKLRKIIKKFKF